MTWQEVESEVKALASKCAPRPDVIVAIARGGLIPARLLAKYLDIKDMYCLTVQKQGSARSITSEIKANLGGKKILLVEDVLESGASLIAAKEYLDVLGAQVKTACIYFQPRTKILPDYYVAEQEDVPAFPWE